MDTSSSMGTSVSSVCSSRVVGTSNNGSWPAEASSAGSSGGEMSVNEDLAEW